MKIVDFEAIQDTISVSGISKIVDDTIEFPLVVSGIPYVWQEDFYKHGFSEYACYCDYWIEKLILSDHRPRNYDLLHKKECSAAAEVCFSCRGQSRGFEGETREWFEKWLFGEERGQLECRCKNPAILTYRTEGQIAGISCVGVYAHGSENGAVVWVRMLAVRPAFQKLGIGKSLLMQSLQYGAEHGAGRAFLHVDIQNEAAVKLYTGAGFLPGDGETQFDMILRR